MEKVNFKISGMHCASCAKVIELNLKEEKGVNSISIDSNSKTAVLEFNPDEIKFSKIREIIEGLGYKVPDADY